MNILFAAAAGLGVYYLAKGKSEPGPAAAPSGSNPVPLNTTEGEKVPAGSTAASAPMAAVTQSTATAGNMKTAAAAAPVTTVRAPAPTGAKLSYNGITALSQSVRTAVNTISPDFLL